MSEKHDQQEPDNDVSYDDHCYECTGYDDEIRYDPETDEYVRNCDDCPYNRYGVKDEW